MGRWGKGKQQLPLLGPSGAECGPCHLPDHLLSTDAGEGGVGHGGCRWAGVTLLALCPSARALDFGYLTQDMIDDYEPALMFTIPRLAIVW